MFGIGKTRSSGAGASLWRVLGRGAARTLGIGFVGIAIYEFATAETPGEQFMIALSVAVPAVGALMAIHYLLSEYLIPYLSERLALKFPTEEHEEQWFQEFRGYMTGYPEINLP
jgi:hypothetical protein